MKRFRLKTLERLRAQELEATGVELHAATSAVAVAVARRDQLAAELRDPPGAPGTGLTTGADLELAGNYRQLLREEIVVEGRQIAELEERLDQARSAWLAARSKLRAVEVLHDRHRIAARADADRREQRELDELAGTRRPGLSIGDPLDVRETAVPHVDLDAARNTLDDPDGPDPRDDDALDNPEVVIP